MRRGLFAVVVMTGALLVLARAVVSLRGYLYTDDFILRYLASVDHPTWEMLTRSYNGHVNPVGWLSLWLLQWAFPGSHTALAVFSLFTWGITLAIAGALGFELTDKVAGAILLMLIAGLSAFGFETSVWFAASIYALPYQLFLVACLFAFVRALRRESRHWLWLGAICYLGAILSYARGFLILLLVFAVVALVPVQGSRVLGVKRGWQWARGYWIGLGSIGALASCPALAEF